MYEIGLSSWQDWATTGVFLGILGLVVWQILTRSRPL